MLRVQPSNTIRDEATGLYKVSINSQYSDEDGIVVYFEFLEDAEELLRAVRRAVG